MINGSTVKHFLYFTLDVEAALNQGTRGTDENIVEVYEFFGERNGFLFETIEFGLEWWTFVECFDNGFRSRMGLFLYWPAYIMLIKSQKFYKFRLEL